jgi:alpha-D-xyloside xylohydrolase
MMRAMMLEFSQDPACAWLDRQYMLGPSLLVAPVFREDGAVSYYLPPGRWTNLISGQAVDGGAWRKETHGYMSLPVMVRPGSIIAMGNNATRPDYDYGDGVVYHVFEVAAGSRCAASLVSTEGREETTLSVRRDDELLTIRKQGGRKPWSVCLRNVTAASGEKNASLTSSPEGLVVVPARGAEEITLRL